MNVETVAQIVGVVSIFLLFALKTYIVSSNQRFMRIGRPAMLWTIVYIYFLFFIRLLSLIGIGTLSSLRIISGFASVIPLLGVLYHLFLQAKEDTPLSFPSDDKKLEVTTEIKVKK